MIKIILFLVFTLTFSSCSLEINTNQVLNQLQDVMNHVNIQRSNNEMIEILNEIYFELKDDSKVDDPVNTDFISTSFSYKEALNNAIKWIENNMDLVSEKEYNEKMLTIKQDLVIASNDLVSLGDQLKEINSAVNQGKDVKGLIKDFLGRLSSLEGLQYVIRTEAALKRSIALNEAAKKSTNILNSLQTVIENIKIKNSNEQLEQVLKDVNNESTGKGYQLPLKSYINSLEKAIQWIKNNAESVSQEKKPKVYSILEDLVLARNDLVVIKEKLENIKLGTKLGFNTELLVHSLKRKLSEKIYVKRTEDALKKLIPLKINKSYN